ncbi:MT-A70 family methyltransferase [Maricaulis maris]|uniref:MT-A70 family methyltransferase n=1 Tax=Maricaulis maris TaxID=74318 RepID=UPI003B8B2CFC
MDWLFDPLPRWRYRCIVVDPPWHFETQTNAGAARSPQAHYQTMTAEEIIRLPIGELAAEDCLLALWATSPHLPIAMRAIQAWGFNYAAIVPWIKTSRSGAPRQGMGYVVRGVAEPILLATRGSLSRILAKPLLGVVMADAPTMDPDDRHAGEARVRTPAVIAQRREHSRKPDCFYPWLADATAGPRADIFARAPLDGWDHWGNEAEKFEPRGGE